MVRFDFSFPELSPAVVENGYSRILSLHEPITCLKVDAGVSFSTTHGMNPLVTLKRWRKLFVGLKHEMGAALADSWSFVHQNLKPLTNLQKSVYSHWPSYKIICKDVSSSA